MNLVVGEWIEGGVTYKSSKAELLSQRRLDLFGLALFFVECLSLNFINYNCSLSTSFYSPTFGISDTNHVPKKFH